MASYNQVTILYEDQLNKSTRPDEFGPHLLLIACVWDEIDGAYHELAKAMKDCRPMKGSSKLLSTCKEDIEDIIGDGRNAVAVFDRDRATELLNLHRESTDEEIIRSIMEACGVPGRLHVLLLGENIESLLRAAGKCDRSISQGRIEEALRKRLNARDLVFRAVSKQDKRDIRNCIQEEVPSFREIVKQAIQLLGAGPNP